MMRRWVVVFGVLIGLAGLMEILIPEWTISWALGLYRIVPIVIAGLVGVAIGVVLVVAGVKRQVGLRTFVIVLGAIFIALSLLAIVEPGLIRDLGFALLLRRSWGFQLMVLWVTGLLRIAIGCALVYAAAKAPRTECPAT